MPGALALVQVVERVAPLQWWPAAATIVGLQLLASLALLRLLRVLLGDRPLLLVPLAVGLFTPVTLGSLTWWAAALNSLPLQAGLAWVAAEAVLLARTGRRRHAVRGTVGVAVTLLFYLKAVLVAPFAFAVVALLLRRDGERAWLVEAERRGRALWAGSLAVLALWAGAFVLTRTAAPVRADGTGAVVDTVVAGFRALGPAVLGGPVGWTTFPPSAPLGDVPAWSVAAGGLVLLAACAWTCLRLRGAVLVWVLVLAEVTGGLLLAGAGRAALDLGEVLPLAYRYFAAEAVVLPVAGALLATLPRRARPGVGAGPLG
jgi:hypothetical protein